MKTVENAEFNNSWYTIGRNGLIVVLWYFVNLLLIKNRYLPLYKLKVVVLRLFGAKIGSNVIIKPGVNIKYPWKLAIGNHSWIGEGVWIDNLDEIVIGNNVCISQGAMLLTGNHNYTKTTFDLILGEITLEDGVWIGAKSVVCPNVRCKSHSVLAVGSVASKDLEPYNIYRGTPAKLVRKRIID